MTHYSPLRFHLTNKLINVVEQDDLRDLLNNFAVFEECIRCIISEWMLEHYCVKELNVVRTTEVPLRNKEGYKTR